MKVLVSACLLGENCKYNGGNNASEAVMNFVSGKEVIPVCPEVRAGFGCPRIPMEIVDGVLTDRNGRVLDTAMRQTIRQILSELKDQQIDCAVLKSRSPTCGVREIYDGTFSGKLVPGAGMFAQALQAAGYRVMDSEDVPE